MPRSRVISGDNETPLIQVITWFLLAISVLSIIARAFTKAAVIRYISVDDYLVPVAAVSVSAFESSLQIKSLTGL